MMASNKLLIVDGHNLLFQMFYGMPNLIIGKNGKSIHAVIGFVGAINNMLKLVKPSHMIVLFDGEHENKRTEILSEYKANRPDYSLVAEVDNPFSQLNDIYQALDFMNIKHIETIEYETDDVISSYVYNYGKTEEIVISSYDSDFFQLIDENVKILRYKGKNSYFCDIDYIRDKYNISPNVYADFKSLTGDNADNIPGVKGIGPKTASILINRHDNLLGIIESIPLYKDNSMYLKLVNSSEVLLKNYQLIKLDNRAQLPFLLDELKYSHPIKTTSEVLIGINLK